MVRTRQYSKAGRSSARPCACWSMVFPRERISSVIFPLDEKHVRSLPVGMAFVVSPDDERKLASITSSGGTLGDFLGSVKLQTLGEPGDRRVVVRDGGGGSQWFSVLAEGDFDHDGVNDLLISSFNAMSGGSYRSAHLSIVSRLKAEGPLVLRGEVGQRTGAHAGR